MGDGVGGEEEEEEEEEEEAEDEEGLCEYRREALMKVLLVTEWAPNEPGRR